MLEYATVVRLDLHEGQTYAWYPDLNIVALARGLDEAGEQRALDDLQAEWRATLRPAARPPNLVYHGAAGARVGSLI